MLLRLVTFRLSKPPSSTSTVGLIQGKNVIDLGSHLKERGANMRTFLENNSLEWLRKERDSNFPTISKLPKYPLEKTKILAPIYNPEKVICVGLNYRDHAIESGMAIPSEPVLFSKFPTCIVGPDDVVSKPKQTNELDYESELVIVIGKKGKNIKESEARSYIAGYTVGNDVSARDWQLKKPGGQWMSGKSFDTFAPIGPNITVDIPDPHNLKIRCILNGNEVQNSNTNQLIFKSEYLLSYISQIMTLHPGDLIFTGTPFGVGLGRKPPLWMKPGDKVTCEIEEIGSITNVIGEALE